MTFDWMLVAAGALTGTLVGFTGVGGGSVMTPLLLLVFGIAPATAVGTDLLVAAGTKLAAARVHHGAGLVDWPIVRRLWLGALPASALTVIVLAFVKVDAATAAFVRDGIACAVLLTALSMLLQRRLHDLGERLRSQSAQGFKRAQAPLTVLAGALLGFLVTLTSIGAGALGVVFLTYLYPRRLTPARLVATDIAYAIPVSLFAGAGHLLVGNVDISLGAHLLLGAVPGALIGARLSSQVPPEWLRRVLAAVLIVTAVKLLLSR